MRRLLLPLIPALLTLAGCSTAHHATMRDATSDTVRIVVSRADTVSVAVPVAGKPGPGATVRHHGLPERPQAP